MSKNPLDMMKGFDARVKVAEPAELKKKLKRCNICAGTTLLLFAGVFGTVMSIIGNLDNLVGNFTLYISQLVMSVYSIYFGLIVLMFELSNSPKVNRYFRENLGFYMTFYGRAVFMLGIGLFACGTGGGFGTGVLSGAVLVADAVFHLYLAKRRPELRALMKETDQARRDGTSEGDDSGIATRVANMAVEDPNKLKQMGKTGANMAASNPGMASAALGMAAAGGGSAFGAPAPAPAPAVQVQVQVDVQAPAPIAPAPVTAFQVDDYDLDGDGGTAI